MSIAKVLPVPEYCDVRGFQIYLSLYFASKDLVSPRSLFPKVTPCNSRIPLKGGIVRRIYSDFKRLYFDLKAAYYNTEPVPHWYNPIVGHRPLPFPSNVLRQDARCCPTPEGICVELKLLIESPSK